VAFLGRSNAGKSTLVNVLLGRALAKVSSQPGKTRLINFFKPKHKKWILVDLPGYGFAARSHSERGDWQRMVESYLLGRDVLKAAVLVMDVRRDWAEEESGLLQWLRAHRPLPVILVLTKMDKLNQKELAARKKHFAGVSGPAHRVYLSGLTKKGLKDLEDAFENVRASW
jgi:GTP-binding protein